MDVSVPGCCEVVNSCVNQFDGNDDDDNELLTLFNRVNQR